MSGPSSAGRAADRPAEEGPAATAGRPAAAAVVGATRWGATLAALLARNGVSTTLLARDRAEVVRLQGGAIAERVPGLVFPDTLHIDADRAALAAAELVVFAVPSQGLARVAADARDALRPGAVLLSGTKGIERHSGRRMSQVLAAAAPGHPVAALSGPNLSQEVARGLPTVTVVASADAPVEWVRGAFHSQRFRVYTSTDVVGVELGGALKNVIAIAAGMVDALGYGDNAKAGLVTRGLAEMARLGVACGASAITFQGIAGMGDLVATAYSPLSRNRRLGELLGGGMPLDRALVAIGETAEGAATVEAALDLGRTHGVELPIAEGLAAILRGVLPPAEAVAALLRRDPRPEVG